MGASGPVAVSRRAVIGAAAAGAGLLAAPLARALTLPDADPLGALRPALLRAALAALAQHGSAIPAHDRIAIVDFAAPSAYPRFHLVDLCDGAISSVRVAHGSGSDPDHTGWLQRFSNEDGSNASSQGAFVTQQLYVGRHGLSQRLAGLDPTNSNAYARALVVHGAWYADPAMLETHDQLGRSQGCFAVGAASLDRVLARLGEGRMIYAAKV